MTLAIPGSIAKANALEEVAIPVLMDDLGSPEIVEENRQLSQD